MKIITVVVLLFFLQLIFSLKLLQSYLQTQNIKKLLLINPNDSIYNIKQNQVFEKHSPQLNQVDTIYYNGTILTMDDNQPIIQAISIKNGFIVQLGSNAHVFSKCSWSVNKIELVNLNGKTMMPGFYDAHSHVTMHALIKATRLSLASPPTGNITSIPQIKNVIRRYIHQKNIKSGEIVYCSLYNELGLIQRRHITRLQLDQVSTEHIIVLQHLNGHVSVGNTKAIIKAGVTQSTPDPAEGIIQRFADGPYKGTPTGLFKERAKSQYLDGFGNKLRKDSQSQKIIEAGLQDYVQAGVTTAQQGYISERIVQLLLGMKDKLKIDIRGYIPCQRLFNSDFQKYASKQTKRFKLQGVKIILDGSIQSYTGYLTKPYFVKPENSDDKYRGFSLFSQTQINQIVRQALSKEVDIIVHANGDAAIDMYLQAIREGQTAYPSSKPRIAILHAQTMRDDQLDQAKRLRVTPSFFVGHTYFWGDQHRDTFLGPERASRISPTGSALAKGIGFTLHNDSPVTPVTNNGFFLIAWSAVNRLTLTGKVLGEEQRISAWQALKALTINAAYQGHQQKTKGSIEKGKIADLIILSENPLKIEPTKLRDITVLETIKDGVSIYKKK